MKVYFKNLNGIRFFAAALVVLHHSFFFTSSFNKHNEFIEAFLHDFGRLGVNIFFVLSGFLISYFLLVEKEETKTVSYKIFYIKRLLRIWPLYFAVGLPITLLSPFLMHKLGLAGAIDTSDILTNLGFLLFFAINIQFLFAYNPGMFEIGWSVCVEEQFYLIWPILINKFRKNIANLIYFMFAFSFFTKIFIYYLLPLMMHISEEDKMLYNYVLVFTKFDLFTTGLIVALIFRRKDDYQATLKKVLHPVTQYAVLALTLLYVLPILKITSNFGIIFFDNLVCGALFGYIMLAAIYDNCVFNFENKLLITLGKISYGIYLFHTSLGQLVLIAFRKLVKHEDSHLVYDLLYPLASLLVVCTVSYFSYNWFELRFLRLNSRFQPKKIRPEEVTVPIGQ